jgi:hypothetical protein
MDRAEGFYRGCHMGALDNPSPNKIVVHGHSVDVDRMTHFLEGSATEKPDNHILASVMGMTNSRAEREEILTMVQGINAMHRLQHPNDNIPELKFKPPYTDWPSSWGTDLELTRTAKPGGDEKTIYEEMDWKDDNKKEHRVYPHE